MAKSKSGRPSAFNDELLDKILEQISEGATERSIFDQPGYPNWRTWSKFKREHPEFIPHYTRAKEDGFESWERKIIDIANDDSRDVIEDAKGNQRSDNTAVNRDRLRIDSMKWLMSKSMPKKYGDKIEQRITDGEGGPFKPVLNITIKK